MKKESQHQRIAEYIKRYGSITSYEAFRDLGITKLTTRISEMRKDKRYKDVEILGEWEEGDNRFGEPDRYMRYTMRG